MSIRKPTLKARYALDNLPNKILAAEYKMVLPDEELIANQLEQTRIELERQIRNTKEER
ncbi:protein of unknown function [Pararobbsia alpina]